MSRTGVEQEEGKGGIWEVEQNRKEGRKDGFNWEDRRKGVGSAAKE